MSTNDQIATVIEPLKGPLKGTAHVPGDKSISHRAVLFSAMAEGTSKLEGVLDSKDVRASIRVVEQLGAAVDLKHQEDGTLAGTITGWGQEGPNQPSAPLDCGNSGTTARLIMGVLAPWDITAEITGDESLVKRPMRRVVSPLTKMGVTFEPDFPKFLPFKETGTRNLKPLDYEPPVASAQLKTAILLAGAFADGTTTVREPFPSRNHTELMLPEYGVATTAGTRIAAVDGPSAMHASDVVVPGDASSAAFLACAALLKRGSNIVIDNVSLNPSRIGFVRTLERMGADIEEAYDGHEGKEPRGKLMVKYTERLHGCEIPSQHIASVIDEIPVLALVAAHARGITVFHDVSELRVKESDRLKGIIDGLEMLGVDAWEEADDLFIEGNPDLQTPQGLTFDPHGDHRLAMTWALVGACGTAPVGIEDFDCVAVSYPDFLSTLQGLVG